MVSDMNLILHCLKLVAVAIFIGISLTQNAATGFTDSELKKEQAQFQTPVVGRDVNITCGGMQISIIVSRDYIRRQKKWLGNGQHLCLSDALCRATVRTTGEAFLSIDGDFTGCGNTITTEESVSETGNMETTLYKFSNTLMNENGVGMVSRPISLSNFECVYPAKQMVSTVASQVDLRVIKIEKISGEMTFYRNKTVYKSQDTTVSALPNDKLYIQVSVNEPSVSGVDSVTFSFVTVIDSCWVTALDAKSAPLANVSIIKEGCSVSDGIELLVNSESLSGRFSINVSDVISKQASRATLHCFVKVCNQTDDGNCIPRCNDRKKRSLAEKQDQPLDLADKQQTKMVKYLVQSNKQEIIYQLPVNELEYFRSEDAFKDYFEEKPSEISVATAKTSTHQPDTSAKQKETIIFVSLLSAVAIVVVIITTLSLILWQRRKKSPKLPPTQDQIIITLDISKP